VCSHTAVLALMVLLGPPTVFTFVLSQHNSARAGVLLVNSRPKDQLHPGLRNSIPLTKAQQHSSP
jgi:hypothetical protein